MLAGFYKNWILHGLYCTGKMLVADISVIIRFPHKANINPSQIGFTSYIRTEVGLLGKPCLSLMSLILRSYERLLLDNLLIWLTVLGFNLY